MSGLDYSMSKPINVLFTGFQIYRYVDDTIKCENPIKIRFTIPASDTADKQTRYITKVLTHKYGTHREFRGVANVYHDSGLRQISYYHKPKNLTYDTPDGYTNIKSDNGFCKSIKSAGAAVRKADNAFWGWYEKGPKKPAAKKITSSPERR